MKIRDFCKKIVPVSHFKIDNYYAKIKKQNTKNNKELTNRLIRLQNSIDQERQEARLDNEKLVQTVKCGIDCFKNLHGETLTQIDDVKKELIMTNQCVKGLLDQLFTIQENIEAFRRDCVNAEKKINEVNNEVREEIKTKVNNVDNKINELRKNEESIKKKLEYKIFKYMDESKIPEALEDWYFERTGKDLDLKNPKTYNEIIQWTKLYDFDDQKCKLVDKYLVRDWVKNKIGEKYLIPLLGVWEKAEEIDFSALPQSFVLKCNHGCGYNIIVKDKSNMNIEETKEKLSYWLHEQYAFKGFEMQYAKIKPLIIAEEYLENEDEDLYDYKVFCFNGRPQYIMFLSERKKKLKMQFYDLDWNLQPFVYTYEKNDAVIEKPDNLDELIRCSEILAKGFAEVRVDFYRLNDGNWKFGEMTFTSAAGTSKWEPEEYDRILGDMIKLPLTERTNEI